MSSRQARSTRSADNEGVSTSAGAHRRTHHRPLAPGHRVRRHRKTATELAGPDRCRTVDPGPRRARASPRQRSGNCGGGQGLRQGSLAVRTVVIRRGRQPSGSGRRIRRHSERLERVTPNPGRIFWSPVVGRPPLSGSPNRLRRRSPGWHGPNSISAVRSARLCSTRPLSARTRCRSTAPTSTTTCSSRALYIHLMTPPLSDCPPTQRDLGSPGWAPAVRLPTTGGVPTASSVSSIILTHISTSGPLLASGIYAEEVYDARAEIDGWSKPGFDDSGWRPAAPHPDIVTPRTRVAPPVRRFPRALPPRRSPPPALSPPVPPPRAARPPSARRAHLAGVGRFPPARSPCSRGSPARRPCSRSPLFSPRLSRSGVVWPRPLPPQRDERLGWTGDIQVFAPTATFLFD